MYVHKLFELFSDVTDQGSRMGVQKYFFKHF